VKSQAQASSQPLDTEPSATPPTFNRKLGTANCKLKTSLGMPESTSPAAGTANATLVPRTDSNPGGLGIREAVLRDPLNPVHRIADRLLPYLRVLVEAFHPEQIILFGSYAYGVPTTHSDVDLLVVMKHDESSLRQRIAVRKEWWKMPRKESLLAIDLIIVSPERHRERLEHAAGFYDTIVHQGLSLL
jgi:uncharacterized protein